MRKQKMLITSENQPEFLLMIITIPATTHPIKTIPPATPPTIAPLDTPSFSTDLAVSGDGLLVSLCQVIVQVIVMSEKAAVKMSNDIIV